MTPEGIKRESEIDRSQSITHVTGRKLDRAVFAVLVAALAYLAYDKFILGPERDVAPIEEVLRLVPELEVEVVNSSCCGMAGSFGYQAETAEISRQMGELSLLPRVRAAGAEALVIADGTSCRHQIADGAGRAAVHVARLLRESSDLALN